MSPLTRAINDATQMRETLRSRPGTSLGFTKQKSVFDGKSEAAFRRSGLDPRSNSKRMFPKGLSGGTTVQERYSTAHKEHFRFYKGLDEISLYTTMRKERAKNELAAARPPRPATKIGLRHVDTAVIKGGRKDLIDFRRSLR